MDYHNSTLPSALISSGPLLQTELDGKFASAKTVEKKQELASSNKRHKLIKQEHKKD